MPLPPINQVVADQMRVASKKKAPEDKIGKIRRLLCMYVNAKLYPSDEAFDSGDFEIVYFTQMLNHWKALLAPSRGARVVYEVTYDDSTKEIYISTFALVRSDHLDSLS